jgi:hypothetical protein
MKTKKKTTPKKKTTAPKRVATPKKRRPQSTKQRKRIPSPPKEPEFAPNGQYIPMNAVLPTEEDYPYYNDSCFCGSDDCANPADKFITTYYYVVDEETREKFVLTGPDLEFDDAVSIAQIMTQSQVRVSPIGPILAFILANILQIQKIETDIHHRL